MPDMEGSVEELFERGKFEKREIGQCDDDIDKLWRCQVRHPNWRVLCQHFLYSQAQEDYNLGCIWCAEGCTTNILLELSKEYDETKKKSFCCVNQGEIFWTEKRSRIDDLLFEQYFQFKLQPFWLRRIVIRRQVSWKEPSSSNKNSRRKYTFFSGKDFYLLWFFKSGCQPLLLFSLQKYWNLMKIHSKRAGNFTTT